MNVPSVPNNNVANIIIVYMYILLIKYHDLIDNLNIAFSPVFALE